ncbi:MAG: hypothetical protein PHT69_04670 [Bacteroidales bacterium]|nr:hypothetical protein [Bacteroidales bacterium]
MKKIIVFFLITLMLFSVDQSFAQRRKKNRRTPVNQTTSPVIPTPETRPAVTQTPSQTVILSNQLNQDSDISEVEVKGVGVRRDDALQDALRNAVGQAMGVSISSQSTVENFILLKDVISSRTEGYVASYTIVSEVPFPDRYEITVKARVSLSPLRADAQTLALAIGGIRFLVMYDSRSLVVDSQENYEFAVERVNEFLANKRYRYIEKRRFETLQREAIGIYQDSETNEESYVQRIGMMADAQFIVFISKINVSSRSEAFDTRTSKKVSVEIKAYDNCTAEGLGTVLLESDWINARDERSALTEGIKLAVNNNFDKLLNLFNSYIGNWVNNGTPYELRFYSIGSFRDFRDLRAKMLEDPRFGGQLEILSFNNYTKLNLTFKDKPDELAYKILDFADAIPEFKDKVLDVKLIYGRQINFAPRNVNVPDLQVVPQSR